MNFLGNNSNTYDPFMVVGTGRCGTSTVARILHENLGVFMGNKFRNGHYEDLEFKDNDDLLVVGGQTLPYWEQRVELYIKERRDRKSYWGLKNPRNSYILGLYLRYFDNPKIIYCAREKKSVIESLMRNYGWDIEKAGALYTERKDALDRILLGRKLLKLEFNSKEYYSDTYIEEKIKHFFGEI